MQEIPAREYINRDMRPPDPNEVDWENAPHPYKLYKGATQIRLSYKSERLLDDHPTKLFMLEQIGQMLADIYGITRLGRISKFLKSSLSASKQVKGNIGFHTSFLRPVPSGGALFPCELYLLVAPKQVLPAGIYHYDVAHHALDILRQGNYISTLNACLAHPGDTPPEYVLLLSCLFGKDSFKYGAFSYRLQGFDIGAVIAQSDLISHLYSLQATTHYQFLDRTVAQLLGLELFHESVYTILTLRQQSTLSSRNGSSMPSNKAQNEQPCVSPLPQAEQFESLTRWPLLQTIHQASLIETQRDFRKLRCLPVLKSPGAKTQLQLPFPSPPLNLLKRLHERRSAQDAFFKAESLTYQQFISLLTTCISGYMNDLDGQTTILQHTLLYCIINHVESISPGVYCFEPETHILKRFHSKNEQEMLQIWSDHNRKNVSLYLIPVGNYEAGFQMYGDRWYRIQNMEAGILLQRLYLAAATLGLGCRAKLTFPEQKADHLMCLPQDYTSLLHIMISPERTGYQYYEQPLHVHS